MLNKGGLHTRATFALVLIGWTIGIALLFAVRYLGTGEFPVFVTRGIQLVPVSLFLSGSVALLHFGAILISDSKSFRRRSYGFFILFQLAFVIVTYLLSMFLVGMAGVLTGSFGPAEVLPIMAEHIVSWRGFASTAYVFVWATLISFIRQMMVKVGPAVLLDLLLGRYHSPRVEQRIFLFVDLQSSTTIAARLGHETYARFIQDCFFDFTDSIIKHDVEVYQYIGDEAVLTWKVKDGLRNANCVRAYFTFIHKLRALAPAYEQRYGQAPFFKAGLNVGPVTVSEIGVVKREIAYLSEVLHTAARIQGKCNDLRQGILLSAAMKSLLEDSPGLGFLSVGKLELRGKADAEELFAVSLDGEFITYPPEAVDRP